MLGFADWVVSGIAHTPAALAVASVLAGALGGLLAGAIAAGARRPALGPALVLAGGILLEGASLASRALSGTALSGALFVTVGLATAGLVTLGREGQRNWTAVRLLVPAALPASAWIATHFSPDPWIQLAGASGPLVLLGLAWLARGIGGGPLAACLLLVVPLGAAQFEFSPPTRSAPPPASPDAKGGPSVVMLVIDTLRADALEPDGALRTFAREGIEFRQCISVAPWTLPAVSSLLTGLFPSQHGAVAAETPLAEELTTLAEYLHAQGYATAAFTGGAFVGTAHRLDQGFDVFDASCERRFEPFRSHVPLIWRLAKNRYLPVRWLVRMIDESIGLEGVSAAALAWAEGAGPGPKFLFLHTYQVHDYYIYDPQDDPVLASQPEPSKRFAGRFSVHPDELLEASQADLEHFRGVYHGRVDAVERAFPDLVAGLEPHVGEDAIWIVTADHGEGFDAATGRVHHGGRLHDDLLHVPLLMRAPGRLEAGRTVEELVRSIDVTPTVLELAGLPEPEGLAGESLLPALGGERPFPASVFAEERAHHYDLIALRRDGWKWIRGPQHEELYHLAEDALELHSIEGDPPAGLRGELSGFPLRFPARRSEKIELDRSTLDHLRALGYVR